MTGASLKIFNHFALNSTNHRAFLNKINRYINIIEKRLGMCKYI